MRNAEISRKTKETDIKLELNIDGLGRMQCDSGIGFFDHMLEVFAKQAKIDLNIECEGDLGVDSHHSIEDIGICLGQAYKLAIGDGMGIMRYASVSLPMDEALCDVALDISGRGLLIYNAPVMAQTINNYDCEITEDFFRAFAHNAGITLHVNLRYGKNTHHIAEAVYKAVGRALRFAAQSDTKETGIPSSKGVL